MSPRSKALLGLLLTPLVAEVLVRVAKPPPRIQVVTASENVELLDLDGVPVWYAFDGREQRWNLDCSNGRSVAAFGSSILYGSGLTPAETWASHTGWCVHNFASPGHSFDAKEAMLERRIDALQPEIVLWEVWATDVESYTFVGDKAYKLEGLRLDARGTPDAFGVPSVLNGALFRHSALFEYATLAIAPLEARDWNPWEDIVERRLPAVRQRVESAGAELIVVLCPVLDRPFQTSLDEPIDMVRAVRPWAEAEGVAVIDLAELLLDQEPEDVRLDTCCHYNAAGMALLGPRLEQWVEVDRHAPDGAGEDEGADEDQSRDDGEHPPGPALPSEGPELAEQVHQARRLRR